jgi:hypothetical protein
VKDESWVASKHHFIVDLVQSALRTGQFMLPTIQVQATSVEAIKTAASI